MSSYTMKSKLLLCALFVLAVVDGALAMRDVPGQVVDLEEEYKLAVLAVYNLTIYPYNEYWIKNFLSGGAAPAVLSPEVCGRVHPFGVHCGPVGVAEYYYGLTPNTITFDQLPPLVIRQVHLTQFFISAKEQKAFSTINYYISAPSTPIDPTTALNATQVGVWRFDDKARIVEFDLWNPLYSTSQRGFKIPYTAPAYKQMLVNETCARYQRFCVGTKYDEFGSVANCTQHLLTKPIGEPDVFSADNVLCRNQHATLTQLRPEVHCAHVGPSGGDFCVDTPFVNYFQKPLSTNKSFDGVATRLIAPLKFAAVLS